MIGSTLLLRLCIAGVLLLLAAGGLAPQASAQPREKCVVEREQAQAHYLEGQFDEAVGLLGQCLERELLFVQEAVLVYRLLSLSHLNNGAVEQAQQAVRTLLGQMPTYQPDPIQDPPSYVAMVDLVRRELGAEKAADRPAAAAQPAPVPVSRRGFAGPRSWLMAAGGALVVATAVFLAFGGEAESSPR